MSDRSAKVLTGILTALIATLTVVLVHREFFGTRAGSSPPSAEYVPGWRDLVTESGFVLDTAAVQIVEFLDLQCPACRGYAPVLESARKRFGVAVSVLYVPYPLRYHPAAHEAARAAECARRLGRFDAFVAAAFVHQDSLGARPWDAYARDAGVASMASFRTCVDDTTSVPLVEGGRTLGTALGARATPTVLLNGWRYASPPGESALRSEIRRLLRGLPPARAVQEGAGPVLPRIRQEGDLTLLEHDAAALRRVPQWVLESRPVSIAGGARADPAWDLTNVESVVLFTDGELATFSAVDAKLLIFGPEGRPVRRVGRRGQGPGELSRVFGVAPVGGDTMALADVGNMRMNWVVPDKGIVRTASLQGRINARTNRLAGALRNGAFVMTSAGWGERGIPGKVTRPPASVALLPPTGSQRLIASVPDVETVAVRTHYEGRPGLESRLLGFGRFAQIVAWDTVIVIGNGEGYQLDLRSPEGQIVSSVRVAIPRRVVTAAMRRASIDTELRKWESYTERPIDPAESYRLIREAPYADSLPPYGQLFVSPGKRLWVVDYIVPGDTMWTATAFRQDGAIVGRLRAASRGRPVAFGVDRVVLRLTDDDGVVSLEVHRIVDARPTHRE